MIPSEDPVAVCLGRLAGLSREAQPFDWACDQVNLGNAWLDRGGEDPGGNVERALSAYGSALQVFTLEANPYEWAMTHMDLAVAFNQRLRGSRSDSLERAITCGEAALGVFCPARMPVETAETLLNLSNSYRDRVQGDRSENLERSIAACNAALALPELSTWLRGALQLNLGIAFQQRVQGVHARNLEEAISHGEAALRMVSPESAPADWALRHMNLAAALSDRVEGDRSENLERAIQGYREALTVLRRESDPVTWAVAQMNLGVIWGDRIAGQRLDNLEQAIGCHERAVEALTLEETPDYWATAQVNLGAAWFNRLLGPRAENLERSIACHLRALKVRTREASPRLWAATQEALGNAYGVRVRGDRAGNVEEAIACLRRALEVRTRETAPAEWAGTTSNLGVMYVNRIEGVRADNLEEAIRFLEQALELRTRDAFPREWASSMLNLGMARRNRTLGDPAENLETAITCFEQCLEVRTRDALPLEWAAVQMNLGIVRSRRLRGDRAGNLEDAVAAYRLALEVWTPEAAPADHAVASMNLGTAYMQRIHGEPAANLREAIAAFEGALAFQTREAMPADWATAMVNLGSAWSSPRMAGDRAENLERALSCYRGALEVRTREAMPVDWALTMLNLGAALTYRLCGDRAENVEAAIEAGQASLEVLRRESMPAAWAFVQANLGFACSQRVGGEWRENAAEAIHFYRSALEVMRPESLSGDCRRVASLLGALLFAEERWTEAVEAYRIALQAAEVLYRSSLLWTSQAEELAAAPDLYRNAAFCLARAGLADEAAVTLERGRARNLSEALARDQAGLAEVAALDPALYGIFREAAGRLRALEAEERLEGPGWRTGGAQPLGEGLRDAKRQARMELDVAISRIRSLDGHGDFLREPDLSEILRAAQPGRPLVYLAATAVGSLALIVAGGEAPRVESLLGPLRSIELAVPWDPDALPEVLVHLGETLIGPVAARLRELGAESVVLIACGPLGLLPLHAARYGPPGEERNLLDEFEISYTPSAGVLNAARAALASRPAAAFDLVGVGNPLPPPAGLSPLPGAEAELAAVDALFPSGACRTFYRHEATLEAFLGAAPVAARIHLGCHGEFDARDPLRSALHLADGEITLREILGRPPFPAARLVVLSACRTAVTEAEDLPDEVLGLPAGILQAGVPGVIGSLWQANDLATLLLMLHFWEVLEAGGPGGDLEPARALRDAQRWLRDATAAELLEWARRYRQESLRGHPLATVAAGAIARFILYDPQARPFGKPSAWAPFVFLGA